MFVQVIQGPVSDAGEMRAAVTSWLQELAPAATGWLGTTAGVTDDGQLVAVVRFDTEESARANSDRPEQDQWWAQTAKIFTAEPQFRESTDVDTDLTGNPDEAGFVQVIQGRSSDPVRARELMQQEDETMRAGRPDILGSLGAVHEGGAYTAVIYFTSEAAAREGEQKEMPEAMAAVMQEMGELEIGEPSFYDLKDPWLHSAG